MYPDYLVMFSSMCFLAFVTAFIAGIIWLVQKIRKKRSKAGTVAIVAFCIGIAFFIAFGIVNGKNTRPADELNTKDDPATSIVTEIPTTEKPATTAEPETAAETETEIETEPHAPLEVMLEMSVEGNEGKPVFVFSTNLPDDTVLGLDITTDIDYPYFRYQEDLTVKHGKAKSPVITNDGKALYGVYYVTVNLYPNEQTEEVQDVIGKDGEYLAGEDVGELNDYHFLIKSFDYTILSNGDAVELVRECFEAGFGDTYGENFSIESEENVILVKLWQDGFAMNAELAALGLEENLEIWNGFVDSAKQASRNLDTVLRNHGYQDIRLVIMVMNDLNMDNHLLIVKSGQVLYDYVNGIDIFEAIMG